MKSQCFMARYQIIVATILLVFLVGCVPSITPTSVPTRTLLPDLTPSSTVILNTSTSDPTPPTAKSSPMPTISPTLVPVPTLTIDERQTLVRELLATNGGCDLPCWWGITPGQTAGSDARSLFASQGVDWVYENELHFDPPLSERPTSYGVDLNITQQAGIIQSIIVHGQVFGDPQSNHFAQDWQRYSLDQVLTRYGMPSQVWVFALPATEPGAVPRYGVTVAYDHLGVTIYYEGVADTPNSKLSACPDLKRTFLILMQLQPSIASATSAQPIFPDGKPYVKSLEEATGMGLDKFYKTFKNADSQACLDLPTTWP